MRTARWLQAGGTFALSFMSWFYLNVPDAIFQPIQLTLSPLQWDDTGSSAFFFMIFRGFVCAAML
jgi:hypothetical protein